MAFLNRSYTIHENRAVKILFLQLLLRRKDPITEDCWNLMPVLMIAYSSSSTVRHFQQQRFYVEYPAVYYIVGGLNRLIGLLRCCVPLLGLTRPLTWHAETNAKWEHLPIRRHRGGKLSNTEIGLLILVVLYTSADRCIHACWRTRQKFKCNRISFLNYKSNTKYKSILHITRASILLVKKVDHKCNHTPTLLKKTLFHVGIKWVVTWVSHTTNAMRAGA